MSAQQLEVIYALAYAHVAQHQYAQALPLFAFLSQYGATRKHYLSGLALCLQMVGRYDEAICIYSLIGTLYPDTPDAALRVAECQLAQADTESARAELVRVLELAGTSGRHGQARARAQALLNLTAREAGA
ncbi:SycD/LcrH family type III secretion system chaperone [Bordetella sp. BOR01]|nr:SycD/LcrH family type III secretion system chaperone [Bordetella sp. BOR01]